jgi:hypothetical protein
MLNVRHNIDEVARGLNDTARREIPFAVSLALNATIGDVKRNAEKRLAKAVDRPTPFTMKAFATRRSSKRRLEATIFAKDAQADYLRWLEQGGERDPSGRAIVVPVGQRVNKYGNLPRGAVARMLGRRDTFSGRAGAGGAGGIYQRVRQGLRLLAYYTPSARYRPGLRFQETARKTAEARMPEQFERAMRQALRSGRG